MFEIQQMNPQTYRQQTRRSTLVIAVIFIALAMLLSSSAVMLFGTPSGDNFRWNLGGVLLALGLTIACVRLVLVLPLDRCAWHWCGWCWSRNINPPLSIGHR